MKLPSATYLMLQRRRTTVVAFLVSVITGGTAGYVLIERWPILDALYMTMITIGSVGFMEVHDLSPVGRIFTMVLIVFGLAAVGYAVSTVTAFIVEGELTDIIGRRRMERRIAGLKEHAKAYSAITAPTVNSYKRLKVGSTASGATWSPVWISYGYNNRTQMLRIPGPGRVEDRTIDGSCNPYLAATAILAAGLDGIESGLDPGDPNSENLYEIPYAELRSRGLETLPSNLLDATEELEGDEAPRRAFGRGRDEDYVDYFIRVKRDEWARYHEQVTPWEVREYLTRF